MRKGIVGVAQMERELRSEVEDVCMGMKQADLPQAWVMNGAGQNCRVGPSSYFWGSQPCLGIFVKSISMIVFLG